MLRRRVQVGGGGAGVRDRTKMLCVSAKRAQNVHKDFGNDPKRSKGRATILLILSFFDRRVLGTSLECQQSGMRRWDILRIVGDPGDFLYRTILQSEGWGVNDGFRLEYTLERNREELIISIDNDRNHREKHGLDRDRFRIIGHDRFKDGIR